MDLLIIEESFIHIPAQGMCPARQVAEDKVVFKGGLRYRIQQFQNYLKLTYLEQPYRQPDHYYGNIRIQNDRGELIGKYTTGMANAVRYTQIDSDCNIEDIKFIRNYGHKFIEVKGELYLYIGEPTLLGLLVSGVDEVTGEEETRYLKASGLEEDYVQLGSSGADDLGEFIEGFFSCHTDHHVKSIISISLDKPYGEMTNWGRRQSRKLKPLKIVEIYGEFIPVDSIDIP